MVYTSPESLKYILECDRDATVNFNQEEPVAKWGRVGVGEVEVQDQEEVEVQDQEEVEVQDQEEVEVQDQEEVEVQDQEEV